MAILLVLLIGGAFIGGAVRMLVRAAPESRGRRRLRWLSIALVLYGGVAFFGQALAALGGLSFLSASTEWPVGWAEGVVTDTEGRSIVPHPSSGRVQVYDADGRFLRGWFVPASGGDFKVDVTGQNQVEVFTARGRERLLYTIDGDLLHRGTYAPRSYGDVGPGAPTVRQFRTPWFLRPFAHPGIAWGVAVVGVLGLASVHLRKPRPSTA